ncbi:MAG TPA: PepSY-like domain-containing protein [Edaphocola sp.]|nr:PepSY-like domain-containing protein [Edaphocola sp.]
MKLKKQLILGLLLATSINVMAQEQVVPFNKMPIEIQKYVKTNFPKNTVLKSEIEKEGQKVGYDVRLSENIKLEFDKKYQVTKIFGRSKLPDKVIPSKINNYVKKHYSQNVIMKWKQEKNKQVIMLDNEFELEFDLQGNLLKVIDQ